MSSFKHLNEYPMKPYTQATNLNEIDQKATKCGIGLGKCLCELADALRMNGKTPEPVSKRVSELMGIPHDKVEPLGRIYRFYRAPMTAGYPVFEFYYLYRIELAVLDAFIPVLRHHFERVQKGVPSNVWLTKHSIEIELDSKSGGKAWFDLKELSLEKVMALSATVNSPPLSAVASQVNPPVVVPSPPVPVATSVVEVGHSVIPTVSAVAMEDFVSSDSTSTERDFESGDMSDFEDDATEYMTDMDWQEVFA